MVPCENIFQICFSIFLYHLVSLPLVSLVILQDILMFFFKKNKFYFMCECTHPFINLSCSYCNSSRIQTLEVLAVLDLWLFLPTGYSVSFQLYWDTVIDTNTCHALIFIYCEVITIVKLVSIFIISLTKCMVRLPPPHPPTPAPMARILKIYRANLNYIMHYY